MQSVLVVPERSVLLRYTDGEGVLTRKIAGVPLLVRVIATAMRAGVHKLLVIWPKDVEQSIWDRCAASPLLQGLQINVLVRPFDPARRVSWAAAGQALENRFLWLPWNWATQKGALAALTARGVPNGEWEFPTLLEKQAVLSHTQGEVAPTPNEPAVEGIPLRPETSMAEAEKFLVARSGKPTDGLHSNFNRMLCRPAVRLLTHTRVTPNMVTLGGLVVGVFAALMYSRGFYAAYVAGALLFFLSGLFDEVDGMLARIKFRESVFGTWFEGLVDEASYLLLFSGITIGLYRQRGPGELTFGYLLLIGAVLSIAVTRLQRKLATSPDKPHEYAGRLNRLLEADASNPISQIVRKLQMFVKKGVSIHYLLIFTVFGGLPWLLRLAALGANMTWILALYFNRRFFRRGNSRPDASEAQIA